MLQLTCRAVDSAMPDALRQRVMELLIDRGSDVTECDWEGTAATREALLDDITAHVQVAHALRSWPPEYWVHIRSQIREV